MARPLGFLFLANLLSYLIASASRCIRMDFLLLLLRISFMYCIYCAGGGEGESRERELRFRLRRWLKNPSKVRLKVAFIIGIISSSLTLPLPPT